MERDIINHAPADDVASFLPTPPEGIQSEPDSIYEIAYQATARSIATQRHHARVAALQEGNAQAKNSPKEWAKQWAADLNSRDQIENEHEPQLTLLRNQLAIANDVLPYTQQTGHQHRDERDMVQYSLGQHIWKHIIFPGKSKLAPDDTSVENRIRGSALTVVSPTGSGKSHMQGVALRGMGIGQPSTVDPSRNRRALVCVSDQAMVNQYLGRVGDNTFRAALGDEVSIGAMWEHDKDADQDVTVVITSSLTELVETGQIDPNEYDVAVVDEGHRALGKRGLQTLQKLGSRLLLFTATPTYDEQRRLEKITNVVSEGSMRDFIERGILSSLRLLTYRPKAGSETVAAAHLACKAIRDGRKVLVYCKPSSSEVEEKDTQYISRLINDELGLKDAVPSAPIGKAINSAEQNTKLIEQFQKGDIRALVTVGMLREGYNDPDVDTVIIIGPRTSLLDVEQKLGRCMRKGDKEALAIELIPERANDDIRQYYSIWNVLGIEAISQGMLIEKKKNTEVFDGLGVNLSPALDDMQLPYLDLAKHNKSDELYAAVTTPAPPVAPVNTNEVLQDIHPVVVSSQESLVESYSLPSEIGEFYNDGPVRAITLSAEANAQEDIKACSTSLSSVAEQSSLPMAWLRGRFDAAKIPYTCIYEFDASTGKRTFERWYEKVALSQYLEKNPLPSELRIGAKSLAKMLGVTNRCLLRAAESLEIEAESGVTEKDGRVVESTYATADILRIEAEIDRIPAASSDDMSMRALMREFKSREWTPTFPESYVRNEQHNIAIYDRRPVLKTGIGTPTDHISADDAERIRNAYEEITVATTDHMSITEIARLAGVTIYTATKYITDEDRIESRWLRKAKNTRPSEYLTRGRGLAVVERLEQKKISRDLVPGPMILARIPTSLNTLQGYIHRNRKKIPTTVMNLNMGKATVISCTTWEGLRAIEDFYGLREGVQPIDYARIARGDTVYAYEVQAQHVDKKYLEPEHDWTPIDAACQALNCTRVALPVLMQLTYGVDVAKLLRHNGQGLEIKTATLERIKRYPAMHAPVDYVSHSRLQREMTKRSLSWPVGRRLSTQDAKIALNSEGTTDIHYRYTAVMTFLKHAEAIKNRPPDNMKNIKH